MLDSRGRDIGETKFLVCYGEATAEIVARNRAIQEATQGRLQTQLHGYPIKSTILYHPTKPEGYGIPHGDPPPY